MVSKREADAGYEPLVPRSCLHPQPERVLCVEHPHLLPLGHKHLVLLLGLKVVDDHQFLEELLLEGVDGRFALGGSRAPRGGGGGVDQVVEGAGRPRVATAMVVVVVAAVGRVRVVLDGRGVAAHVSSWLGGRPAAPQTTSGVVVVAAAATTAV